jgi:DNA-binding transcriptional MocR family regulator
MSAQAMSWAVEQDLPAMKKIVLIMLCNHANKSMMRFPSHETLAKDCGMSKRSVISKIDELEKEGFIGVERSCNKVNIYQINLEFENKSFANQSVKYVAHNLH